MKHITIIKKIKYLKDIDEEIKRKEMIRNMLTKIDICEYCFGELKGYKIEASEAKPPVVYLTLGTRKAGVCEKHLSELKQETTQMIEELKQIKADNYYKIKESLI